MHQVSRAALVAALGVAFAGCSDIPVQPDGNQVPSFSQVGASAPEQVMPGEVIVKPRAGAGISAIAAAHGLGVAARGVGGRFFVLRGVAGNEHANAAALRGDARVQYAEPN